MDNLVSCIQQSNTNKSCDNNQQQSNSEICDQFVFGMNNTCDLTYTLVNQECQKSEFPSDNVFLQISESVIRHNASVEIGEINFETQCNIESDFLNNNKLSKFEFENTQDKLNVCEKHVSSPTKMSDSLLSHDILTDENVNYKNEKIKKIDSKEYNDRKLNSKTDNYVCKYCSKMFSSQSIFIGHMRTHPEYKDKLLKKPKKIDIIEKCNKGKLISKVKSITEENNKENKLHISARHNKQDNLLSSLKHSCSVCKMDFLRIEKLREHQQLKHKNNVIDENCSSEEYNTLLNTKKVTF